MRPRLRSLLRRRRLRVFSGTSNPELAERIAERLGTTLGPVEHETFANGETYCRFGESIRGADVFLVQSCSPPVNDHLVELLLMIHAARLASAHRITAVMPWFPYSRQDKKSASAGADLGPARGRRSRGCRYRSSAHDGPPCRTDSGLLRDPGRPYDGAAALRRALSRARPSRRELVAVSPDLGRVKLARRLGEALNADLAVVTKTRPGHDVAEAAEVVGAVRGKVVVMGDDMIVTGSTLVERDRGAPGGGCPRGPRIRDSRALRRGRSRAAAGVRARRDRRDRHGSHSGTKTFEADRPVRRRRARGHHRKRLRGPFGVGAVRRPGALLTIAPLTRIGGRRPVGRTLARSRPPLREASRGSRRRALRPSSMPLRGFEGPLVAARCRSR